MLRRYKGELLLSSLVILLPLAAALALPETAQGLWILPPVLLGVQWLGILLTSRDPGNREQHPKAFRLVIWILPVLSCVIMGFFCFVFLGRTKLALGLMQLLFGFLFLILGNYMPKIRRNHTIGIRIFWTLRSEENWTATHRFAGKVWVLCGLAVLLGAFLPGMWGKVGMLLILLPAVALPVVYSWSFHRRQVKNGTAPEPREATPYEKTGRRITWAVLPVTAVLLGVLLFTGEIRPVFTDTGLTLEASFSKDPFWAYAEMEAVEYRPQGVEGSRVLGFGSPRLLMGTFANGEFGNYTRYTYAGCGSAVVITLAGDTVVLSGRDDAATQTLYRELLAHLPE